MYSTDMPGAKVQFSPVGLLQGDATHELLIFVDTPAGRAKSILHVMIAHGPIEIQRAASMWKQASSDTTARQVWILKPLFLVHALVAIVDSASRREAVFDPSTEGDLLHRISQLQDKGQF
jgi:hypothetical protein